MAIDQAMHSIYLVQFLHGTGQSNIYDSVLRTDTMMAKEAIIEHYCENGEVFIQINFANRNVLVYLYYV